jgi:hypothetical protein
MRWTPLTEFSAHGPNARFFAKLNEIIRALNSLRAIQSPNSLVTRDVHGTSKTPLAIPAARGASGIVFKGEWSSSATYSANEATLIRGGTTAGLYLSLTDGNEDLPYDSENWVQIAKNNEVGNWT